MRLVRLGQLAAGLGYACCALCALQMANMLRSGQWRPALTLAVYATALGVLGYLNSRTDRRRQ